MKEITEKEKFKELFENIASEEKWNQNSLNKILRKFKKNDGQLYRNDELVKMFVIVKKDFSKKNISLIEKRIRLKPTRTNSGVSVVTVMMMPYYCPGNCIFCPNDRSMPKSYIASEPGGQRALKMKFDPYAQVFNRLIALKNVGHNIEKIELIVLGGTFSAYSGEYKIWFVKEMFRALNDMKKSSKEYIEPRDSGFEISSFEELEKEQIKNEKAYCRNVGLVLETRPDFLSNGELIYLRRLGATKIQIGIQSLSEKVLRENETGRSVEDTKRAFELLRLFGFKIHGHWMPNLYLSTEKEDIRGYKELFTTPYHPDEMKIYPTSVIPNTELFDLYKKGKYKPYTEETLVEVVSECIASTPRYCRLSRVIRDIPSQEIVAGNKRTNLRQIVEEYLRKKGIEPEDIRSREIKGEDVRREDIVLEKIEYNTSTGREVFLSYNIKSEDKICGFLRLSLPKKNISKNHPLEELSNSSIIREVHVYGKVVGIDKESKEGESQHLGLGKELVLLAENISKKKGFKKISVISAIGTREYYKKLGYKRDDLYMFKGI
ncbi:tRNA uridine(34) 5-carboxymethylaminomethyl modification radical SAM/GNAT enzyme Elp3 [Candidatus Dojkabacteria bacterium]|uniref:tRNA carboxymethyluridine synthase n=1 Tax=Candidatus Dojkabacteria bacterium TaxID=2099670 RepID=A0A847CZF8_9BACT|nr:tRNA uridine(34) 5-carboxymethylaminomethyl modification radical SAM/GNAT enzyme Elp3 [Candidatus Dojkabacteria bacterium]